MASRPYARSVNMTLYGKDLDSVLGTMNAIANVGGGREFMSNIITYGAAATSEAFKLHADKYDDTSNGGIAHMYDWKTAKSRGSGERAIDHTKPLWKNILSKNVGTTKTMTYEFLDSKRTVPNSTLYTGNKKYIFKQKAKVMETGMIVHVKPLNDGGLLFVPFDHWTPEGISAAQRERGYMMAHDTHPQPGKSVMGNFSSLWQQYFHGEGQRVFNSSTTAAVREIFEREYEWSLRSGSVFDLKDLDVRMTSYIGKAEARLINASRERAREAVTEVE